MWRPNPKNSKPVIFRKITFDEDTTDEYGHPKQSHEDIHRIAEIYPYSDVIKREAVGITNEIAYLLVTKHIEFSAHDIVVIDKLHYRIKNTAEYDPMQIIIASTGEKDG